VPGRVLLGTFAGLGGFRSVSNLGRERLLPAGDRGESFSSSNDCRAAASTLSGLDGSAISPLVVVEVRGGGLGISISG
jgi:hypothetical protein